MKTDNQFFNKPRCKNCGSPEVYPCSYCMSKKEYNKIVREIKIKKAIIIGVYTLIPTLYFRARKNA